MKTAGDHNVKKIGGCPLFINTVTAFKLLVPGFFFDDFELRRIQGGKNWDIGERELLTRINFFIKVKESHGKYIVSFGFCPYKKTSISGIFKFRLDFSSI